MRLSLDIPISGISNSLGYSFRVPNRVIHALNLRPVHQGQALQKIEHRLGHLGKKLGEKNVETSPTMDGVTRGSRDNILSIRGVGNGANVRFSALPNYSISLGISNSNGFVTKFRKDVLSSERVSSGPHTPSIPFKRLANCTNGSVRGSRDDASPINKR